ncbi:MAG: hypothetical protein CM1200mP12_20270 [Gammaproteobacteria bacterium]|nr:MAG: hypothetical protein CM1200mP12_20270 [Gammaproteobacteria bacterium]
MSAGVAEILHFPILIKKFGWKEWAIKVGPALCGQGIWRWGLTHEENKVLQEEMFSMGARPALASFGIWMWDLPFLSLLHMNKKEHIPNIVKGKIWWCQGYSEPGSGSDWLAPVQSC